MASQAGSVTVPEKFLKPFHKLSLDQLAGAKRKVGSSNWSVVLRGRKEVEVELHMVWVQGLVERRDREGDWLVLAEGGCRARVEALRATPGSGADWVQEGQYVQVGAGVGVGVGAAVVLSGSISCTVVGAGVIQ